MTELQPVASGPLNRGWRVLATGLSFALFGIGGLLLWFAVFPLLRLLVRDSARCARIARGLIQRCFRIFIGFMRVMGVLSWEAHGIERLQRSGLLVLANHPSLLDVVFLGALVPDAVCLVKAAVLRNPFMRGPVLASGYLGNDDGPGLVADCVAALQAGSNLIIFPEGTRTPIGVELGPFQRGAANIALRGGRAVTPVSIRCQPPTLKKGQQWYDVPSRRMHFCIEVGPDLPVAAADDSAHQPLAARQLSERWRDHFLGELRRAGTGTGHQAADRVGAES